MNAGILRVKIDLKKLDHSALFKTEKATYLDLSVLMKDGEDQYGNHGMVVQDVGKQRREAGEKGPILGNVKWIIQPGQGTQQAQPAAKAAPAQDQDEDDIPF